MIDQLAEEHGLNRTDYMVRASTGDLRDPIDLETRLVEIDRRLSRMEDLTFAAPFM